MKIYRNSYYSEHHSSVGFEFFANKNQAISAMNKFKKKYGKDFNDFSSIELIEFAPTKKGIIDTLNHFASYPQNGKINE